MDCPKRLKQVRPEYVEANMRTYIKVTENKHLINLTGNPNSCLIKIGKQRIRCLIDSGATTSIISWKVYKTLTCKPNLQNASAHLESVDGSA